MILQEKINNDFKEALKSGEQERRSTLGLLRAALLNKAIEKKSKDKPLGDDEVLAVISSEIKRRREAAAQYAQGDRKDLAEKEEREAGILAAYLPPQLSREELEKMIGEAIAKTGAFSEKDFGKVMGALAPQVKGRAGGALVAQIVKAKLSG